MAVSEVASTTNTTVGLGTVKSFLLAHPVGVALVGGAAVAGVTFWVMNKFFNKKDEPAAVAAKE